MAPRTSALRSPLALAAVITAALAAAVISTPRVEAAPINSIYRDYYSSNSFTTRVGGRWILQCGGGSTPVAGTRTAFYRESRWACENASPNPIFEQCYVDGFFGPCP